LQVASFEAPSPGIAVTSNAPPKLMKAAVYQGEGVIAVEEVAVPAIGPGELLVRVEACGVCHTDLKKVQYNLLPPPRVYGHETAGVVVQLGAGVNGFAVGDRVVIFHHIPCGDCFYCRRKLYAQCPVYKKVGVTAGFEPAGGGFAQYVRVMDWIASRGVEKIPDGVSFEVASFVEPVNTCLKAVEQLAAGPGDVVVVMGQGPIGLIFTMLLKERGVGVIATDTIPGRLRLARQSGAMEAVDPRSDDAADIARKRTGGRGADAVVVATAAHGLVEQAMECSRPGARILLFAQTSPTERIELSGAGICVGERILFGSYSASVDVQKESAALVFGGRIPLDILISHRLPLESIKKAFDLATRPTADSLKIVVNPNG
jgi:L-iditol 2-dehydrogenase